MNLTAQLGFGVLVLKLENKLNYIKISVPPRILSLSSFS